MESIEHESTKELMKEQRVSEDRAHNDGPVHGNGYFQSFMAHLLRWLMGTASQMVVITALSYQILQRLISK